MNHPCAHPPINPGPLNYDTTPPDIAHIQFHEPPELPRSRGDINQRVVNDRKRNRRQLPSYAKPQHRPKTQHIHRHQNDQPNAGPSRESTPTTTTAFPFLIHPAPKQTPKAAPSSVPLSNLKSEFANSLSHPCRSVIDASCSLASIRGFNSFVAPGLPRSPHVNPGQPTHFSKPSKPFLICST
jgi:hypothetical protein